MHSEQSSNPSAARQASSAWPIKTFKDRDEWIRLLLAVDVATLSHGAKVLAIRVAHHHNIETGQCNPSMTMLAEGTGTSASTVRRFLHELEQEGWLGVDRSQGRHSNSFELRAPTLSTDDRVQPYQKVTGFEKTNPVNCWQGNPVKSSTSTLSPGDGQKSERRKANRKAKESDSPRLDLGKEDGRRQEGMTPDEIDSSFEQFYRQYPKHVAKAAALKAYRAVISKKLATPEELLAGALRFAAERSGQDPQFTKHAQTWLNSQCWLDEPSRPAGNMIDGDGNPVIERPPPDRRQQSAYGPQFAAALETARRLADKGGQP